MKTEIISIYNNKGGVGKTTTAKMLAKYLSADKKVLLIDMDPQGNLSSQYLKENEIHLTTYDILLNGIDINEAVTSVDDNISIIPADLKLLNANNKMMLNAMEQTPVLRLKRRNKE